MKRPLLQEPLERPTEGADRRGAVDMAADVIVVHTYMYVCIYIYIYAKPHAMDTHFSLTA